MNSVLVITLGTREVQFQKGVALACGFNIIEKQLKFPGSDIVLDVYPNQSFRDYFCFAEPRTAGCMILKYWKEFKPILMFPIIDQTVHRYIEDPGISILSLVYTDQKDLDLDDFSQRNNWNKDTVQFLNIIRKYYSEKWPELFRNDSMDIGITEKVTDIDFLYKEFARKGRQLIHEEIDFNQIFLLAQGGIDQINHALTLQLIQAYKTKVKLLQQPEGADSKELLFPFLFLRDLNRQKLKKHAEDFSFELITEDILAFYALASGDNKVSKTIYSLSQYANERLQLRHEQINTKELLQKLQPHISAELYARMAIPMQNEGSYDFIKLKDLYIGAKICLKHENYRDFLWKIYTLSENLFKIQVEKRIGIRVKKLRQVPGNKNGDNEKWIQTIRKLNPNLPEFLRSKAIALDNPNRWSYYWIYYYLTTDNKELKAINRRLHENIEKLASQRNSIAHDLKPMSKQKIEKELVKDYNIECLIRDLDRVLETTGYGIFENIQQELLRLSDL